MIPAAIETMKATSTTLLIERARLDGVLQALCEVGGFNKMARKYSARIATLADHVAARARA